MTVRELEKVLTADAVEFCNHSGSRTIFRGTAEAARQTFRDFGEYEVLSVESTRNAGEVLVWLAI